MNAILASPNWGLSKGETETPKSKSNQQMINVCIARAVKRFPWAELIFRILKTKTNEI